MCAGAEGLGFSIQYARNPRSAIASRWLYVSLALIIGMVGVALLVNVILPALAALGVWSAGLTALIFLLGAGWDLATSGADITNGASPRFSRSARLLLYLAYAMMAALIFMFTGAQHLANGSSPQRYPPDTDLLLPGLYALGIPVVILTAILRIGRSWPTGVR